MKIGEFAKNCHISIRMVRFYEQLNLIKPTRTQNGYRYYSERHIDEVKKIRILNQVGIPLKDIALLQNCLQNNVQTICPLLREKLQQKQKEIQQQINTLSYSEKLINKILLTQNNK